MSALWQDLRYALRSLRKSPGLASAAVLALALGIGANTSIYSIVNALVLHPSPYLDDDRVVTIQSTDETGGGWVFGQDLEAARRLPVFDRVAALYGVRRVYEGRDGPRQMPVAVCSRELFEVLGVRAAVGSLSGADATPVAVLSHAFWKNQLGADAAAIGRPLRLDNDSYLIVGVLPPDFRYPVDVPEVWTPRSIETEDLAAGLPPLLARLGPGVSIRQAEQALTTISRPREAGSPRAEHLTVAPAREQLAGPIRPVLRALRLTVGFVLMIACINVASLLLARATSMRREVALRQALGASSQRLVTSVLGESFILAAAGAALALPLSILLLDAVRHFAPLAMSDVAISEPRLDRHVLFFTSLVAFGAALFAGVLPARRVWRASPGDLLRAGREPREASWARSALIVSETGLALTVLFLSFLMVRSFRRVSQADLGLQTSRILTAEIQLPWDRYPSIATRRTFFRDLCDRVAQLPGVVATAVSVVTPLGGSSFAREFSIAPASGSSLAKMSAEFRNVSPGYFRTMGIPLDRGRAFTEADDEKASLVAVLNRTLAKRLWSNHDPVGERLRVTFPAGPVEAQVIGVAADSRLIAPDQPPPATIYVSHLQRPVPFMTLLVRAAGDPRALAGAVRAQALALDRHQPVGRITTLEEVLETRVARRRFNAAVFGLFAGVALLLGAIAVSAQVAHSVAKRTREIGIRLAVGATPAGVVSHFLGHALRLVVLGGLVGVGVSLALGQTVSHLLYEVGPADPVSFAGAAATLLAVAAAAAYFPARRAARVDPNIALRAE